MENSKEDQMEEMQGTDYNLKENESVSKLCSMSGFGFRNFEP
jgi:hypothetical protein